MTDFSMSRDHLADALKLACRVVPKRTRIAALGAVLICATDAGLTIAATDLDQMLQLRLPADVDQPGEVALDAFALNDVIRKLPKGSTVRVQVADDKATVSAGRSRSVLSAVATDSFPIFAEPKGAEHFELDLADVGQMLATVRVAMSTEETRYYLCGVAIERDADSLTFTATDGKRLATNALPAPAGASIAPGGFIVPACAVKMIGHVAAAHDGPALWAFGSKSAEVDFGAGVFRFKAVDGTFPDWRRALSDKLDAGDLQQMPALAMALNPHLSEPGVRKLAAPVGDFVLETNEGGAFLTSPAHPAWMAWHMFADGDSKFRVNGRDGSYETVRSYFVHLATSRGFAVDGGQSVRINKGRDGAYMGATFGESTWVPGFGREELDWQTLATRTVHVPGYNEWAEGAFSVPMPGAGPRFDVTVELDGAEHGMPTDAAGAIVLSAEAVAELAGDPAEFERVRIPALTFQAGRGIIAIDGIATDGTGRTVTMPGALSGHCAGDGKGKWYKRPKVRPLTDREVMDIYRADPESVMRGLQPVYSDAPAPAVAPVAVESVQCAEEPEKSDQPLQADRDPADVDIDPAITDPTRYDDYDPFERGRPTRRLGDGPAEMPPVDHADAIADLQARVAALESARQVEPAHALESPAQGRAARSPAHVRALRAYVAMRRARNVLRGVADAAVDRAEQLQSELAKAEARRSGTAMQRDEYAADVERLQAKRRRSTLRAVAMRSTVMTSGRALQAERARAALMSQKLAALEGWQRVGKAAEQAGSGDARIFRFPVADAA